MGQAEQSEQWHCNTTQFWGTTAQLTTCARCGEHEAKPHNAPRHYRDYFKPTFHMICDACYEELPS